MIRKWLKRLVLWCIKEKVNAWDLHAKMFVVYKKQTDEYIQSLERQVKTVPQLHDINVKRIEELKQKIEYMQQDIRDLQHDAEALDKRIDG